MVNGSHSGATSAIRAIRDNRFDTRLFLRASFLTGGCQRAFCSRRRSANLARAANEKLIAASVVAQDLPAWFLCLAS